MEADYAIFTGELRAVPRAGCMLVACQVMQVRMERQESAAGRIAQMSHPVLQHDSKTTFRNCASDSRHASSGPRPLQQETSRVHHAVLSHVSVSRGSR